jgi:hypothetical protein
VVRGTARVGVMRADPQSGSMVHEAVQHVWRLMAGRGHHPHIVGPMLIGDVGAKAQTRILTIAGIYNASGVAPFARAKELPV